MPYSCSPDEIDPSIVLPDIAQEILSIQSSLRALWNEYTDIALLSGLADPTQEPSEIMHHLESTMMRVAEHGAHSALSFQPSEVDWVDEWGNPKSMRYTRDGEITYTLDSGERFSAKD